MVISGHPFLSSFKKHIAKGLNSLFWKDEAVGGDHKLKDLFPRLFALEKDKNVPFKDRWNLHNGSWSGSWDWRSVVRGRSSGDLCEMEALLRYMRYRDTGSDI